jgi:hypothetical protein
MISKIIYAIGIIFSLFFMFISLITDKNNMVIYFGITGIINAILYIGVKNHD